MKNADLWRRRALQVAFDLSFYVLGISALWGFILGTVYFVKTNTFEPVRGTTHVELRASQGPKRHFICTEVP